MGRRVNSVSELKPINSRMSGNSPPFMRLTGEYHFSISLLSDGDSEDGYSLLAKLNFGLATNNLLLSTHAYGCDA